MPRLLFLALFPAGLAALPIAAGGEQLALTGGVLIDGSGAPPRRATLLLRGERIEALLPPDTPAPAGARVIELDGRVVLPGLIDACVRLAEDPALAPAGSAPALAALLSAGVTTARSLGGAQAGQLALRQAIAAGALPGPRLLVAGDELDPGEADDLDALRAAVRQQAGAGVDLLLVGPRTPPAALRVVLSEARRHGLPVLGRLWRTPWTFAARDRIGGLLGPAPWSIFYAEPRDREPLRISLRQRSESDAQLEWLQRVEVDSEPMQRLRRWLRRRQVPVTPLLARQLAAAAPAGAGAVERSAAARAAWPLLAAQVARLHAARVPLVAGSGATGAELVAGGGLALELEALGRAGLTPLEVITAATGGAADALGIAERVGRLRPGLRADLVVLERSPLADLAQLRSIERVFVGGREWRPGSRTASVGAEPPGTAPGAAAAELPVERERAGQELGQRR